MSFTLYIRTERWRAHQKSVFDAYPGLVPVVKGNGYGFGNARLAEEAARLGADTVAVGMEGEAAPALEAFAGDVVVLTPVLPGSFAGPGRASDRLVRTVASLDGLRACSGGRVIIDCMTSLRRHGITGADLAALAPATADVTVEGFAVHLPLDRPSGTDPVAEVSAWVRRLEDAGMAPGTLFVSHLTGTDLEVLRQRHRGVRLRPRIGTALWLGDREASTWRGQVQDVTPIRRGQRYGYRQRRALTGGHLVVVTGGTSHGVGLEAPRSARGPLPRAKQVARAGLAATNHALSPFVWAGRQRWFAEPPHMQVSLLLLPAGVRPPVPGDELTAQVRYTTSYFDRLVDE